MLTLERLEGMQLADLDLEATPMDERRRLAILIAETWLEMSFRHGHFTATRTRPTSSSSMTVASGWSTSA